MEADEALAKLKREYPEIELHILEEALRNNDFDFRRTSEALRARFYDEDAGIPQEESLWTSIAAPFGTASGPHTSKAQSSDWDWSLESLTDGVNALGASLLMGVETVTDTIGTLGDIIPDLIFGEEYYEDEDGVRQSRRERDQVVVGSSRNNAVKKRGAPHAAKQESPPAARHQQEEEYATDESGDDWTKED